MPQLTGRTTLPPQKLLLKLESFPSDMRILNNVFTRLAGLRLAWERCWSLGGGVKRLFNQWLRQALTQRDVGGSPLVVANATLLIDVAGASIRVHMTAHHHIHLKFLQKLL